MSTTKLIEYGPKDSVPEHIHKQLVSMNYKSGGELLRSYKYRSITDSVLIVLVDKSESKVLSWACAYPWYYEKRDRYIPHEINFWTRVPERGKGYFEVVARQCLRRFRGKLAVHDPAYDILKRKFKRSIKRIIRA